ncbi:MAG: 23S rRNA (guanosine(2251)-2'-O)-methyltransferase RlmB [Treponema sp.]|nr:23S rRNA (guanosine(2251)-2'-O)-methyltransferase RlmB [Treponema sp.]
MTYLTGFHAIEEWIKAGKPAASLLVAKAGPRARELLTLAQAHRIRIDRTGTYDLDRLAPGHRGIALQVEGYAGGGSFSAGTSVKDFLTGLAEEADALVLILDEITDPHNYGAILRCCDQFAVDLVISRKARSAKNAEVIGKTSAGAAAWVPAAEEANLVRAIDMLKGAGFWVYGAGMEGESAYKKELKGRVAIILGSEGEGISRLLRERCDAMIGIPSLGRIDSLNVSVAAGILLYEVRRQKRNPSGD